MASNARPEVTIIDYGAGNLRSVAKALESLGHKPLVTNSASDVEHATRLILPGVGAAADTMTSLERLGLTEPVVRYIESAGRSSASAWGYRCCSTAPRRADGSRAWA